MGRNWIPDKVNYITPLNPIRKAPRNLDDTDVENAIQRSFALDRAQRRILTQRNVPKQRYPRVSHSIGGVTSNQSYGWYGANGGHVVNNNMFHKPKRTTGLTEYIEKYRQTWHVNPLIKYRNTEFHRAIDGEPVKKK